MSPAFRFKINLFSFLYLAGSMVFVFGQSKPGTEVDVSKCWAYASASPSSSVLAADNQQIYIGSSEGRVEAVSLGGKKIWESEFGGVINSNLLSFDNGLLVITSTLPNDPLIPGTSTLRSLSKETGIMNWGIAVPAADFHHLFHFEHSAIVVSGNGEIRSIDLKTGEVESNREIRAKVVAEPAFNGERVIVATAAKQLLTISLTTGKIESNRPTPFNSTAVMENDQMQIIAGDDRGNVTSFGAAAAKDWSFRSGGEISGLLAVGPNILAASYDNFVYLLAGSNGSVVWKKRLTGRPAQISKVGDLYAVIAVDDAHNAILIDLSNGKVVGQMTFDVSERLMYKPITSGGRIYVITNRNLYAYSLNGCSPQM